MTGQGMMDPEAAPGAGQGEHWGMSQGAVNRARLLHSLPSLGVPLPPWVVPPQSGSSAALQEAGPGRLGGRGTRGDAQAERGQTIGSRKR